MANRRIKADNRKKRNILLPSHTKGYYRFAKDFPSVTDGEGYRDNEVFRNSPEKKASLKRRLGVLFACVFAVSYIVTMLCLSVSNLPAEKEGEIAPGDNQAVTALGGYNAVSLSGDVLSYISVESLISDFKMFGVDTVVIEFKDAAGNFYFRPSIAVSNDALYKAAEDAAATVRQFHDADIDVIARVACYADDIFARNNQSDAAYVMISPESGSYDSIKTLWYNTDADSHAWLDPFSSSVQYYLRTIIEDIEAMQVDGIIYDYAVLPPSAASDNAVFGGALTSEKTVQEQMTQFLFTLNSTYINCATGVCIPADVMLTSLTEKTIPSVAYSGCDFIVPDASLSLMPDDTVLGNMKFKKPSVSPSEFITAYMSSIYTLLNTDEAVADTEVMPVLEASDSSSLQIDAAAAAGVKSYLMHSDEMLYIQENFK